MVFIIVAIWLYSKKYISTRLTNLGNFLNEFLDILIMKVRQPLK